MRAGIDDFLSPGLKVGGCLLERGDGKSSCQQFGFRTHTGFLPCISISS